MVSDAIYPLDLSQEAKAHEHEAHNHLPVPPVKHDIVDHLHYREWNGEAENLDYMTCVNL